MEENVASDAESSSSFDFYASGTPETPSVNPDVLGNERNGSGINTSGHAVLLKDEIRPPALASELLDKSAMSYQTNGVKRKYETSSDTPTVNTNDIHPIKKARSSPALDYGLPRVRSLTPVLWQKIFTHLSPLDLGAMAQVCKSFAFYLMHSQPESSSTTQSLMLESEAVWASSRRNTLPSIPRPLIGVSEREMFTLLLGVKCQFCGRLPLTGPPSGLLHAGPGEHGVRIIWPFHVRSCSACLNDRILKDTEILQHHPEWRDLRFGLPHALWTASQHFISDSTRHDHPEINAQLANLRVSKVYFRDDLVEIAAEYEEAKHYGDGAADEWRKGLVAVGKDAMADSARWEKWEDQKVFFGANFSRSPREYIMSLLRTSTVAVAAKSRSNGAAMPQPLVAAHVPHPLPVRPSNGFSLDGNSPSDNALPHTMYQHMSFPVAPHVGPYAALYAPLPLPGYGYVPAQHGNQRMQGAHRTRGPEEVEAARQARRAEIVRRCGLLQPPIPIDVLQHISSFHDAMQIAMPMTDEAWKILEPKIESQREEAELKEYVRKQDQAAWEFMAAASLPQKTVHTKSQKDNEAQQYQRAQAPLRSKLAEYADDCINGRWAGGRGLDQANAPHFAVHVLLHVQKRYEEDKSLNMLPTDIPESSFLSLDNMKWVFENKVRSFLEKDHRNIWVCARCVEATGEKQDPKAFEGLIQHYGAVHSSAFGQDNVSVLWQTAHWPDEPPFHTDPGRWIKGARQYNIAPVRIESWSAVNGQETQPSANGNYTSHGGAFAQNTSKSDNREALIESLAFIMRESWDALEGVKGLLSCIRVQVAIHHGTAYISAEHHHTARLELLTESLASHSLMRPLKGADNLVCKRCIASLGGTYYARLRQAPKLYTLSALVNHFAIAHAVDMKRWTQTMLDLPENSVVKELLDTPGMDDDKLALVASAFPRAFPQPLPKIGVVTEDAGRANVALAGNVLSRLNKKQQYRDRKARKAAAKLESAVHAEDDSAPDVSSQIEVEDEYDPRQPMLKGRLPNPSRFDTDLSRKSTDQSADLSRLSPDILDALQSRGDRSPSVGRRSPARVASNPAPATGAQPDISAILAALTAQGVVSGPAPASLPIDSRSISMSGQNSHGDNIGTAPTHNTVQAAYPTPPNAATSAALQELQASLHGSAGQQQHPQGLMSASYTPNVTAPFPPPGYQLVPAYGSTPTSMPYSPPDDPGTIAFRQNRPAQYMGIDDRGNPYNLIPVDPTGSQPPPLPVAYIPSYYANPPSGSSQPIFTSLPPGGFQYANYAAAPPPGGRIEHNQPLSGHISYEHLQYPPASRY